MVKLKLQFPVFIEDSPSFFNKKQKTKKTSVLFVAVIDHSKLSRLGYFGILLCQKYWILQLLGYKRLVWTW